MPNLVRFLTNIVALVAGLVTLTVGVPHFQAIAQTPDFMSSAVANSKATATRTSTKTRTPFPTPSPTPTATAAALKITPVADAYVDAANASTNYGTVTQLRSDQSPAQTSYLRFGVTGTGGAVSKATLWVYANSAQSMGFDVHRVATTSWAETSITASNAPPWDAAVLGSSGPIQAGSWTSVDLTALIMGDKSYSLALTTKSSTGVSYASRETGARSPYLTLTLEGTPAATSTRTPTTVGASPTATRTPTRTPTAAPGTTTRTPTATATTTSSGGVPSFNHVYVLLMENKEYGNIVGSSAAPYLNSLIAQYGLATNFNAVAHPSEPNYLALFSGSTQGVTDDGVYNLSGTNLADQLEAKGKTWRVYAQNVPLNCYTGSTASGGEDGTGSYARKHEPAISFTNISGNASRCANISDFTHFDAAVANYTFIVPNQCNSMHDCSVAAGDNWLKSWVPGHILNTPAWSSGLNVLFIVWDEGTSGTGGGGHIANIVVSNDLVSAGIKSATPHNHYSLLRTVEDAWGLGCLHNTCSANNLGEFFK